MGDYDLFSFPVMALKFASGTNGVSQLHGAVSREMWQWMFPNVPLHEVPVGAVTNGIHVQTWTSRDMGLLFDRYLRPSWRSNPADPEVWKDVDRVPDAELWRTHERRRERLVSFTRERLRQQMIARGAPANQIDAAEEVLNPDALTIGFARRFATYKRATLIFSDVERLIKIVNNQERPLQIIFAGKAHPHDQPGKEFIRDIVEKASLPELRHAVVFLENYDMTIGRYMVQGVDVWLNNPRRPKEASGTSGMKVIYNGGLNASVLDGWWDEGYHPSLGWAIGNGEQYPSEGEELQDAIEAEALYDLLETDILPAFYDRGRDGLPREWIAMMKRSIKTLAARFSTDRMLREYTEHYYVPTHQRYTSLTTPDIEGARAYARWLKSLRIQWESVKIVSVETHGQNLPVGETVDVRAVIDLGKLTPDDVKVQVYSGPLNTKGEIVQGRAQDMHPTDGGNGTFTFEAALSYDTSGDRGLSVRVLPSHPDLPDPFLTGFIRWANGRSSKS
jgi:starch phosphorylase